MSAFMVSKEHIDAMVATAIYGPTDNASPAGYGQSRWSLYFRSQRLAIDLASDAGDMLVRENLSSIHYRYPDTQTNPEATPGPCDNYWLQEYKFPRNAKRLTTVQALKAIRCYMYQSCEHPEWEQSEAYRFCQAFTANLVSCLPGYEQAEWEIAA